MAYPNDDQDDPARQALLDELQNGGSAPAGGSPLGAVAQKQPDNRPIKQAGSFTAGQAEHNALLGYMGFPEAGAPVGGAAPPVNTTMPIGGGSNTLPVREPVAPGGPKMESDMAPAGDDLAWRQSLRDRALGQGGPGKSFGWNTGDYGGDAVARNSMKNTFHAIAQNFPSTPSGLRAMVQSEDFKRAFPNAKIVEHPTGDKIDFGGQLSDYTKGKPVGVVDVGRAFDGANDSGEGWDWMDEANDGGGGGAAPGGMDINSLIGGGESMTAGGDDRMAQILAAIEALGRGEDPSREALLQELL